jgi:hypothetical protein
MPGDVNIGGKLRSHREQYGGVLCKDRVDVRGTRWVHKLNQKHDKHQGSRIMSLPSKKCIHVSMQTACFHVALTSKDIFVAFAVKEYPWWRWWRKYK